MSSGPGGTNWKTNVNRAKTKRWVEAKSYTYDGDDWGDADEYGEYGDYNEEPEPPPKPTGLRQAGKGSAPANVPHQPQQQIPQPLRDNLQLGQPQPPFQSFDRDRANSFGRGDDRPNFPGPPNPQFSQPPANRSSSPQSRGPPPNRMRAPSDTASQRGQPPARPSFEQARSVSNQGYPPRDPWNDGSRAQSMTNSSAGPYQRREFTHPSVAPQPLQSRPPRKSSSGQSDVGLPNPIPPLQTSLPLVGPETQSPQQQSTSTPTFVRPADIYRRMQEEKEKERLSQESSRPSMDTIHRSRDPSPGNASDTERKPRKPALESVAERRSEYGMEGLLAAAKPNQHPTAESLRDSPKLPEIPGLEGFGQGFGESFMTLPGEGKSLENQGQTPLARTAAFSGTTGVSKTADSASDVQAQPTFQGDSANPSEPGTLTKTLSPDSALQREPSLGIRSAVNQAFDSQVPPTPTSTSDSNLDRSNSESTNDISPIISRNASGAVTRPEKEEIPSISSIAEEPPSPPRPESAATSRPLAGARPDSKDSLQALKQGHRRNISTPSPDNSPARTPNVEANRQLQSPQEAELAMTTPTAAAHTTISASNQPEEKSQPASRAGSPTKGRVRDLVDKLDSADNSRRGSATSLKDVAEQSQRPNLDANQSFRPQLPGAWSSYTTNELPRPAQRDSQSATPVAQDPFSAAAAAGTALAGALAAAAGIKSTSAEEEEAKSEEATKSRRTSAKNLVIHPQAQRLSLPREDSDAPSSIVPTPMYMKPETASSEKQEYFAPVTPLNQKPRANAPKELPQLEKTRTYEDMSTESSPNDLESDRLRKELVRELSPQVEEFSQGHGSNAEPSEGSPTQARGHESVFLPSEYESYWNTAEGGESSRKASEIGSLPAGSPPALAQAHTRLGQYAPAPQESHQKEAQGQVLNEYGRTATSSQTQQTPTPTQSTPVTPAGPRAQEGQPKQQRLSHRFSWEGPAESESQTPQASDVAASHLRDEITSEQPLPPLPQESKHEHTASTQSLPNVNKELPQGPRDLSDANDNTGATRPSQPTLIESSAESVADEPLPQSSAQAKIPAFREIMAIKDINERLRIYDTTRTQFANMNTGLSHWIQATVNQFPEHSDLLRNGGSFGPQIRPTPIASSPQANSHRPSPVSVGKSSFSPGAGKITSEKGKDLLRTAGVFSGKANSAAKGFFSKGRNKLRGKGGDKAPRGFRKPSQTSASPQSIVAGTPDPFQEPADKSVPTSQATPTTFLPTSHGTEPSAIDNVSSADDQYPTMHSDQHETQTESIEHAQGSETPRASIRSPVSPVSARASFEHRRENRRASLQQKRASMDTHATTLPDFGIRLTVHQNQMKPFEQSFPPNLIIPAEYPNLPAYPNDPKRRTVENATPTQASFPATNQNAKNGESSLSNGLSLDTDVASRQNSYNAPASPDYDTGAHQGPKEQLHMGAFDEAPGERSSSLSFIRFADIQSEGFALKEPETPYENRFERESQSTFDQTAFESPERTLRHVESVEAGSRPSVQSRSRSVSVNSKSKAGPPRSASTRSSLPRAWKRQDSEQSGFNQVDSPTIPIDTFRVIDQPHQKKQPGISLFPKTRDQKTQQRPAEPAQTQGQSQQEAPAVTPATAVDTSQPKSSRKKQRSSLLGPFGIKGLDGRARSRVNFHRTGETELPRWNTAGFAMEQKAVDAPVYTDPNAEQPQRAATMTQTQEKAKKRGRFSGLSSFISKASPRRQSSGASRSQSISPFPRTKLDSKLQSTPEQPLYGATAMDHHVPESFSERPAQSSQRQPMQVSRGHRKTPSDAGQAGMDYKSVFPPEFYAQNPPVEGYYGSPQMTTNFEPSNDEQMPPSSPPAPAEEPLAAPLTAYAANSSRHKRVSGSGQVSQPTKQTDMGEDRAQSVNSTTIVPATKASQAQKKAQSPKREIMRSIESDTFDIETPPPPPPKDERYVSPANRRQSDGVGRTKRSSITTSTKVSASGSPIVTTTTTTATAKQKRHSSSGQANRSTRVQPHNRASSSGGLLQTPLPGAPTPSYKPPKASFRQSLPPLRTQNLLADDTTQKSQADTLQGSSSKSKRRSLQHSVTTDSPTIITTTTINPKPSKSIDPVLEEAVPEGQNEQPSKPQIDGTSEQNTEQSVQSYGTTEPVEPFARQTSPVEKMKDEPRSAVTGEGNTRPEDSEDEIVMSSTAYPGQEWRPAFNYGAWEGD